MEQQCPSCPIYNILYIHKGRKGWNSSVPAALYIVYYIYIKEGKDGTSVSQLPYI